MRDFFESDQGHAHSRCYQFSPTFELRGTAPSSHLALALLAAPFVRRDFEDRGEADQDVYDFCERTAENSVDNIVIEETDNAPGNSSNDKYGKCDRV